MQTHVMMGRTAYDMHHPDRYALYLLNNILGGNGMNSRLNMALREKNGLVYNVGSNAEFYTDTGVFSLYFACNPRYVDRCVQLVEKELQRLREERLTPVQLATAKKQLKGQLMISAENHENVALSMAKDFYILMNFTLLTRCWRKSIPLPPSRCKRLQLMFSIRLSCPNCVTCKAICL